MINNNKYLKLLQKRIGYLAIGGNTLRNQGAPGVVETARQYLQGMNLTPIIKIKSEIKYKSFLERHTKALSKKFPNGAKGNCGAARKSINLFLRDCLYNQYLSNKYDLSKLEKWLEIPLDRQVAEELYNNNKYSQMLPKWKSIKSLKKDVSDKYQKCAQEVAKKNGIARVHLDLEYWRKNT